MPEGLDINRAKVSKESHLLPGIKPIMSCVGSWDDYGRRERAFLWQKYGVINDMTHDVDYQGNPSLLKRNDFLNAGKETYVISPLDDKNKISERFIDCTGLVVTGIDEKTGESISFVSHQDPVKFLDKKRTDFVAHLRERIEEVLKRCKPGTIDAVIIGGKYLIADDIDTGTIDFRDNYLNSIKLLSAEVYQALGFEPVIINGPKLEGGYDDIIYENKDRRIYFFRRKINRNGKDFINSDVESEKERWDQYPDERRKKLEDESKK